MSVEEREVQEEKEDNNDEVELQIRRKHQVLSSFRRRIPRVARMESGHQQNASGEAAEESDHEIQLECPLLWNVVPFLLNRTSSRRSLLQNAY